MKAKNIYKMLNYFIVCAISISVFLSAVPANSDSTFQVEIDPFYVGTNTSFGFSIFNGLSYAVTPTVEYYDQNGELFDPKSGEIAPGEIWVDIPGGISKYPFVARGVMSVTVHKKPDIEKIVGVQHVIKDDVDQLHRIMR